MNEHIATPRTDNEIERGRNWNSSTNFVHEEFARELERELAIAENALNKLGWEKFGFGWGITISEPNPKTP